MKVGDSVKIKGKTIFPKSWVWNISRKYRDGTFELRHGPATTSKFSEDELIAV